MELPAGGSIFDFQAVLSMILNLNQMTFQAFGAVFPERNTQERGSDFPGTRQTLHLGQGDAPVYRLAEACRLITTAGTAVVSVSRDGKEFQHFYLDKPVAIHAGIFFSLSPLNESATVDVTAPLPLVSQESLCHSGDFRLLPTNRVDSIYTFFYQEKEQAFFFPGESHPMAELTYVDGGTLHSVADGRDLLLKQGDLVLYAPDQWHMQYADIGVAPRFITISFHLTGGDLSCLTHRKLSPSQQVVSLLQQMLREQERMDSYATDMLLCLMNQLLLTLLREAQGPSQKLKTAHAVHAENEIIRRAQQYVGSHIREKLSVPLVARMVDVSPSYLTALFHKHLQISPGEYIRRIKLQESKQMIRENNMNFTEIAAALQYSTVHHFSRQFKEKFGITPTQYAKSVR